MAKIGIKAWSLLASAVFAMIVVVGCNPEEPAPTTTPTAGPKATAGRASDQGAGSHGDPHDQAGRDQEALNEPTARGPNSLKEARSVPALSCGESSPWRELASPIVL